MIHVGDCLETLRTLPSDSVDCIVTSPPYWGLRDYGVAGQIGQEPDFRDYLAKLVEVFEECRRVLKPSGTCWVNMGDGYSERGGKPGNNNLGQPHTDSYLRASSIGLKPKNLIGMPWRLALALQEAGWYLRSDIIWHKPNPMPESVRDRPTKAHEYLFLLTKSQRYYYDADAIRTELAESSVVRLAQGVDSQNARVLGKTNETMKAVKFGGNKGCADNPTYSGNEWKGGKGANARTVWTIPTGRFKGAHFATFPPELPKRCISAGCPEGGTVLDPFAGAGTTLMVAKQLGRKWIGMELNADYVEMAKMRIGEEDDTFELVPEPEPRKRNPRPVVDAEGFARMKTEAGVRDFARLAGLDPDQVAHIWKVAVESPAHQTKDKTGVPVTDYKLVAKFIESSGVLK